MVYWREARPAVALFKYASANGACKMGLSRAESLRRPLPIAIYNHSVTFRHAVVQKPHAKPADVTKDKKYLYGRLLIASVLCSMQRRAADGAEHAAPDLSAIF